MSELPKIYAPFTPPEVVELNRYQHSFWHPFTCGNPNRNDANHTEYAITHGGDNGTLIATRDGWVCPVDGCGYTQNWAHAPMLRILDPYEETGPFDLEPMERNPVTKQRAPTKNGVRPIQTYYCIYDHPADFPKKIVVRQWHIYEGVNGPIEDEHRLVNTIDEARTLIAATGANSKIDRFPEDDPYIVEVWVQRKAETI